MRYALRAMQLLKPFLPMGDNLKSEILYILARATSNEHKWNGAEVFTKYAEENVPSVIKQMAERAAIYHLEFEEDYLNKDSRITATKIASRRRQTLVRTSYEDNDLGESCVTTNLVVTDQLSRVNIVVAMGEEKESGLTFVENTNMTTEQLHELYPTAYVVRMSNLASDSLKRINQLSTQMHLENITKSFSGFALNHGISIDSLADPDHTLPDTMRKILTVEINARIHHAALQLLNEHNKATIEEIHELITEATALNTHFSFGGLGHMFFHKLTLLIDEVAKKFNEETLNYITDLITVADWLKIFINKTSLENHVFGIYKQYKAEPDGKFAALKPMFQWLNFEVV
jgi:hypothetical protein